MAHPHLGEVLVEDVGPVAFGVQPPIHHGLRGGVAGGDVLPRGAVGHAGLGQGGEAAPPVWPGVGEEDGQLPGPDLGRLGEVFRQGQGGQTVELTRNELKILACLLAHPGQIVPRADLIEALWDSEIYIDDNTLSVNVTRLRAKLGQLGLGEAIKTRRGMGYPYDGTGLSR